MSFFRMKTTSKWKEIISDYLELGIKKNSINYSSLCYYLKKEILNEYYKLSFNILTVCLNPFLALKQPVQCNSFK